MYLAEVKMHSKQRTFPLTYCSSYPEKQAFSEPIPLSDTHFGDQVWSVDCAQALIESDSSVFSGLQAMIPKC